MRRTPLAVGYLRRHGDLIETPGFRGYPVVDGGAAGAEGPRDRHDHNVAHGTGPLHARHALLARAVADQAAVAIENARLFEETQRRGREMEALLRADEELFQSLSLDAVFQALVDVCVDVLGVQVDCDDRRRRRRPRYDPRVTKLRSEVARTYGRHPCEDAARRAGKLAEPIVNHDVRLTPSEMTPVFEAKESARRSTCRSS